MITALICLSVVVVDGDGIRCSNLGRVRLLGIDAPDYQSSSPCRQGYGDHVCDDAGARQAKASLQAVIGEGKVHVIAITNDRYGRMIAQASVNGRDMSCWQIQKGVARYIVKYDNGRRIARACPGSTR